MNSALKLNFYCPVQQPLKVGTMATTDETCYLCYDKATEGDPFVEPNPCICKGTIKLHNRCAQELMNNSESCGVCKATWKFTGVKRKFWPNGKLQEEIYYVNGKKEGLFKRYHYNGQLREESLVIDGNVKYSKTYHEDGKLASECVSREDIFNIKYYRCWYENGTLQADMSYIIENNIYVNKWYRRNGQLTLEFDRDENNNRLIGLAKTYHENGKIHQIYDYDNIDGEDSYKEYNLDGELIKVDIFRKHDYYNIYTNIRFTC